MFLCRCPGLQPQTLLFLRKLKLIDIEIHNAFGAPERMEIRYSRFVPALCTQRMLVMVDAVLTESRIASSCIMATKCLATSCTRRRSQCRLPSRSVHSCAIARLTVALCGDDVLQSDKREGITHRDITIAFPLFKGQSAPEVARFCGQLAALACADDCKQRVFAYLPTQVRSVLCSPAHAPAFHTVSWSSGRRRTPA